MKPHVPIFLITIALAAFTFFIGRETARMRTPHDSKLRYELHVTPAAEIIRLDRVTGAIHIVTSRGEIKDLPESWQPQPNDLTRR
jgi:hypothetical protein